MKGHRLPSAALAATATIVAAVLTSATAPASPAASTPAPIRSGTAPFAAKPASDRPDVAAATAQLAKDERLQPSEAARRIARQDTQVTAADTLRSRLGSGFGGAWIDHRHGGRLTVAVVDRSRRGARPSSPTPNAASLGKTVAAVTAANGLSDTRTVAVRRSETELRAISATVATRIAAVNTGAKHGLQSAIDVTHNAVRVDLPKAKPLTAAQRTAVAWASARYGDAVTLGSYAQPSVPRYCGGQYSCDPPLRSGLATYMSGGRCTTAFMTYSGGAYYMLTAGHCAEMGSYFYVPTYYYGTQYVGYAVDYDFGYWGDSALIYVEDSSWWQPRGWVYPQTVIRSYGYDYVGQYVCKQGSTTGYTCGQVTETDATVHYPDRTLTGMTWSTACVAAGDSGSGVYYGSRAYGILSGGPYSGCGMIHEPVTRALGRWGVSLLAG